MNLLVEQLKTSLSSLESSALESKKAATNEESKAEHKYDTRGLEASYLAGAQARRVEELRGSIESLSKINLENHKETIKLHSLIKLKGDEELDQFFFLLPYEGGARVIYEQVGILVITPHSPIGMKLMGKEVGDEFEIRTKKVTKEYEILEIW